MALIGRLVSNIRCCRPVGGIYHAMKEIHTTTVTRLDQSWRQKKRLPENPNAFGPLTNLPDYSYTDGRPTPFGVRMLNRINKQREILKKVRQLTSEVDFAVKRHERIQREKKEHRERVLDSKLKPKGQKLAIEARPEVPKISQS
ncbi:39S ribosomal protein L52, mitochondrial [Diachasma alloeum]|uniref:39S ribosomal protein L52, mitochondrial n=1 Tax=Diachasma alloeum TaxID=454923 RepID=UPI00073812B7|nr:39S ribosomal protein L52, mitochondrial [Diachasma alloeum]